MLRTISWIKGGPGTQTGGTPLTNLTATPDLEESASHHFATAQLLAKLSDRKPYPVAHVKFRRVQVPEWLNQGLSMSTFVRTREMVVNYAREG